MLTFSIGSPLARIASAAFVLAAACLGRDAAGVAGAGLPVQLAIAAQPGAAASGASLIPQPAVQLRDAANNLVSTSSASVSVIIASGAGSLRGATTANAVNGTATFVDLAVVGTGPFSLRFSSGSLPPIASNVFTVAATAGPPTQLAITTQPSSSATSGTTIAQQPAIQLRDASNLSVSQSGIVVTAAIATGGGTLGGTLTAATNASGVATFTNLSITGTSGGRTLTFTAPGLTRVTSASINVTAPVTGTGFATPNILNNVSFENSWSGFTNWAAGIPSGSGLSLDNTLAYDGSWSIRRSWSPNPGGDVGAQLAYNFGSTDRIWVRFYFRLTAPITSVMKFARFYGPGFGTAVGGLFLGQGSNIFTFSSDIENSAIGTTLGLTQARVIDGNWHSLEMEYWRNGDPSGWPSVAFWFDGQPLSLPDGTPVQYDCRTVAAGATCSKAYWQGGRLYTGVRAGSSSLGVMEWLATLNAGNTTTGQVNLDRIAISTAGRIGP